MSGDEGSLDFEKLLSERAVKELYRSEDRADSIILTNFPQYGIEDIADLAIGDRRRLLDAAVSAQAHKDIMSLMIAVSSQDKKATKRLFSSLEKVAEGRD